MEKLPPTPVEILREMHQIMMVRERMIGHALAQAVNKPGEETERLLNEAYSKGYKELRDRIEVFHFYDMMREKENQEREKENPIS